MKVLSKLSLLKIVIVIIIYCICCIILFSKFIIFYYLLFLIIHHISFKVYIIISLFIICCISFIFIHSFISSCCLTLLYIYASQIAHSECYISFAKVYCLSYIAVHEILFCHQSVLSNLRKLLFMRNIYFQSKWSVYYVRTLMYVSSR